MYYTVVLLDADKCELSNTEEGTLAAAKSLARSRIAERGYLQAGARKVEVRDANGDVVWDKLAATQASIKTNVQQRAITSTERGAVRESQHELASAAHAKLDWLGRGLK